MRRTTAAVLAAVLSLAAVGLAAWALLGQHGTGVGQNVFVNPAGIIDAYSTPTITLNPRNPASVVVSYREDRPDLSARLSWSLDGGSSFRPTALPLPPGLDRPFFPDAAFGPDGVLYVTYVNLGGRGNVPANLWVSRSTDGGRSLSDPVLLAPGMTFQPRIAVGGGGSVDVTWLQSSRMGQPALTGEMVRLMLAQSLDGGQHWSAPAPVNEADGRLVGAASVVLDRGSVVVAYERFGPTAANLGTGGTTPQPETYDIVVTRSGQPGAGFAPPVVVAAGIQTTQRFSFFFPEFPSLAAAPDGSLYLAWARGLARGQDTLVARSGDLGATWSTPARANDNPPGDGTSRRLPTLSVAADGRVDVVLLDQRNDRSGIYAEAFLASSGDGGRTFHDVLLSSATFDTQVGPTFGGNLPPDLGSHLSVASQGRVVHAAWADSRLGSQSTGRQDIVTARVDLGSSGPGAGKWLVGAAVVLLAAAVALFGWGRRARR